MDYATTTKRSRCAWAGESVPYPVHQVGYQRFRETFGVEVPQLSAQIHSGGNGVPRHLLAWYGIPVCYQNWAKIQIEKARRWICESEASERFPQSIEPRTWPRNENSRQLAKAASKEKRCEAEEGSRKVVRVPQEPHSQHKWVSGQAVISVQDKGFRIRCILWH